MKSLISAVVVAAALTAPVVSFAQSSQPVTRAQVRAELVQLEKAGYTPPSGDWINYPANIQAAEARVAVENRTAATAGYGAPAMGTSQAGHLGN